MRNFERYAEELKKIADEGDGVAVVEGQPIRCSQVDCEKCLFYNSDTCVSAFIRWAVEAPKTTTERLTDAVVRAYRQNPATSYIISRDVIHGTYKVTFAYDSCQISFTLNVRDILTATDEELYDKVKLLHHKAIIEKFGGQDDDIQ